MPAPRQRNARIHKPWEPIYPPGPVIDVPAWTEEARCTEVGGDEFFPEKGGSSRAAKQVCMSCEVRVQCLEWALANDERFGVWGGKSERDRRKIKRDRAAAAAKEVAA